MIRITVKDVAKAANGRFFSKDPDAVVGGFSIDSRTIERGQFFIAVKGENFDGHDFIADAVNKGAAGLIVDRPVSRDWQGKAGHVIAVGDTREAMGMIAAEIRRRVDIPVVCVTGTNGKTTVKDILSHILSLRYKVLKSVKSYNNIIGLSLTLFDLDPSHEGAVLEIGTSHPGEIRKLAEIAAPGIGVITNIGNGHLGSFGAAENVYVEKTNLLDILPRGGTAFLNKDDCLLAGAGAPGVKRKFYGASRGSDFLISGLSKKREGVEFSLNGNSFFVPMEGEHNIYNAAAASAVAEHLGMRHDEIRESLAGVSLTEMRLEKVSVNGVLFINDAYNANPDSFECALRVLQDSPSRGRKGVVAGDMLELGGRSEEFHRMTGRSMADKGVDFLIALGGRAEGIARGALEAGMGTDRVLRAESHEHAAGMIRQMASPGTVVLLKGSRAAKMEDVLKCFTISCTP